MAQHQQLINQYMHMNIQLLNQKLETLEKGNKDEKEKKPEITKQEEETDSKKHPKKTYNRINLEKR